MIDHVIDMLKCMGPKSQDLHLDQVNVWRKATEDALNNPEFRNKSPDRLDRLNKLYSNSIFLSFSGRLILTQGLVDSPNDYNYIMPTTSNSVFDRLQREQKSMVIRDIGAFFISTESRARNVGTICLRPAEQFTSIDREAIITHELTHAYDRLNNDYNVRLSASIETKSSPELTIQYEKAIREFNAYNTSAIVLSNETDGMFDYYYEDMFEDARNSVKNGRNNIKIPKIDSYTNLIGLSTVESTSISKVIERLYDDDLISPDSMIGAMAINGLII